MIKYNHLLWRDSERPGYRSLSVELQQWFSPNTNCPSYRRNAAEIALIYTTTTARLLTDWHGVSIYRVMWRITNSTWCVSDSGWARKKTLHFNICLLNKLSGCEHPAAVATKAFSVAERQYSASQLEARRWQQMGIHMWLAARVAH